MIGVFYNFVFNIFYWIMAIIDSLVYTFFQVVMLLFFTLNSIVNANEFIDVLSRRLYVLVGIFALFKLSFSLINAVVNPEKLTDKEQGFTNIIQRVVVSMVMLLACPFVFDKLYEYQDDIIEAIPQVILGNGSTESYNRVSLSLARTTLKAFIIPNENCHDNDATDNSSYSSDNNGLLEIYDLVTQQCSSDDTQYRYTYIFIISTITGVVMTILFLFICFDVVQRVFKLLTLQMLAPLPIISYIDPKSAKGGMFDSWLKLTVKTYISLFVQIASVYFVIALIVQLIHSINPADLLLLGIAGLVPQVQWIYLVILIFVVVGGLLFLVKSKKFINQALGIKEEEKNFLKNAAQTLAVGTTLYGMAVGGAAAARTGVDHLASKNPNATKFQRFLQGTIGFAKGAAVSGYTGLLSATSGKSPFETAQAVQKANQDLENEQELGLTLSQKIKAKLSIVSTDYDRYKKLQEKNASVNDAAKALKKTLEDEAIKDNKAVGTGTIKDINGNDIFITANYRDLESKYNGMAEHDTVTISGHNLSKTQVAALLQDNSGLLKSQGADFFSNGGGNDLTRQAIAKFNHEMSVLYGNDALQIDLSGANVNFADEYEKIIDARNAGGANSSAILYGGDYFELTNSNYRAKSQRQTVNGQTQNPWINSSKKYESGEFDRAKVAAGIVDKK